MLGEGVAAGDGRIAPQHDAGRARRYYAIHEDAGIHDFDAPAFPDHLGADGEGTVADGTEQIYGEPGNEQVWILPMGFHRMG